MPYKMTAIFIGRDGSLGYRRMKEYQLVVEESEYPPIRILKPIPCPYGTLRAFLDNWAILSHEHF